MSGNVTSTRFSFEAELERAAESLEPDPARALEHASKLAKAQPDARAFRLAAAALRSLGRADEAAEVELQAIRFGFTPPLRQAVDAQQARQSGRSKALAEEYLRAHPDDLLAMTIAAEAAIALHQHDVAERLLRRVLERAPAFPRGAFLLANALVSRQRLREAIAVMEDLHRRVPADDNARRFLADLHAQRGDFLDSARLYGEVVASGPSNTADLFRYAHSLRASGHKAESIAALRRAADLAPTEGRAWWALAQYFPDELRDEDFDRICAALEQPGPDTADAGLLRIASSVLHHRRGEFEQAFKAVSSVKAARRPTPPYDADVLTRHIDELIAAYPPELFSSRASEGSNSNTPIFIFGMPRSGSTLVERILGCHSKIEALGEIQVMARLIADEQRPAVHSYSSPLPGLLATGKPAELAARYLRGAQEFRHSEKPRFIDKYNANWIHAGLIRLMFPNARILDVRRDPVDCCWSVFRMMFGDDYANDQRDLARYYVDYTRYIAAVDAASPGGIMTVRYEELVGDLEGQTRRMLDFIGVDYERSCVDFHLATGGVATPSSEQVRRPLNREGLGAAAPYVEWLGPMIDELDKRGAIERRPR